MLVGAAPRQGVLLARAHCGSRSCHRAFYISSRWLTELIRQRDKLLDVLCERLY